MANIRTLREIREALGYTRKKLAKKASLSERTLVRLEQGEPGHTRSIEQLAAALGMPRAALLDAIDASRPLVHADTHTAP